MAYFVLECPAEPGKPKARLNPYQGFNGDWFGGHSFTIPPPIPVELTWDPDTEMGDRVTYYDWAPPVLMRKDLLAALRAAGVDNLEDYPAIIHSKRGNPDCLDYVAVNVIGAIAAANLEESEISDEGNGMIDMSFDSLVIDEEKAGGQLLFRLAESVTTVIIHEKVVEQLKRQGGFGLTFTRPEDYVEI